ncbi:MAG TPA: lactonase family protein [Anaerolineales bacterium]|nr:lactonase family protein [Anaerolineales bacterium]
MSSTAKNPLVFIGTYTEREGSQSKGIYVYEMSLSSGELTRERKVQGVLNPSYLAIHPLQDFLYGINEVEIFADEEGGGVTAFALDAESGEARLLNAHSSRGKSPCYISIEQTGRFALVANYSGGNAAMLPIRADGRLGPASDVVQHSGSSVDPERQTAPFVHCILPDPTNRFAIATDLGADKLVIYQLDLENGKLNKHGEVNVKPGSGPRHIIFHPNQKYLYLINELNSTLVVYRYDSNAGSLEEIQTISTLPPDFQGENLCADLHIYGKYLYASNRKHDSLAWYLIDEASGRLSYQGEVPSGGKEPRGFAIDPSGSFLLAAHERSDNVVVFQIDPSIGKPLATGIEIRVSQPVCVKFIER